MRDTLERIGTQARGCAERAVWPLSDKELVDCLQAAHVARQRLAAVCAHLVHEIQGRNLPARQQATSTPEDFPQVF